MNWGDYLSNSRTHLIESDLKRRQYAPQPGRTMPVLDDLPIGGSRQFHLAVLSIDIRGFTSIALQLNNANLQKLARLQALYLAEMSAIIHDYNGATEKYTGDGVMGLFGTESNTTAPTDVSNDTSAT